MLVLLGLSNELKWRPDDSFFIFSNPNTDPRFLGRRRGQSNILEKAWLNIRTQLSLSLLKLRIKNKSEIHSKTTLPQCQ